MQRFIRKSDQELSGVDIAELNLACAAGLPGAEELDVPAMLAKLDEWAELVAYGTRNLEHRFHENPAEFQNSFNRYRMVVLITVLQRNLGVTYNQAWISEPGNQPLDGQSLADSRDLFLHGILSGHGGTCNTMPVLYTAVGRRLEYPIRLVAAKTHMFARWDSADGGERFNIEATSHGFNSPSDEHYSKWPFPMTRADLASGRYLRSLTPRQELALFAANRGHCLYDNHRYFEAADAFEFASDLDMKNRGYDDWMVKALQTGGGMLRKQHSEIQQSNPLKQFDGTFIAGAGIPEPPKK